MSSITTQQTKLDLELVPKEKRLDIRKCNGRLNPRNIQREPIFQVVLDALALTPCYSDFLSLQMFQKSTCISSDIFKICPRVQGQDFDALPTDEEIRTFAALINRSLSGKTTGLDKLHLSKAQILWGMYHQKNVDYVELFWEDFIYQIDNKAYKKQEKIPEMKETKAYKTYLGFASGATPPKKARKFKKPASPKLTTVPVSTEEPTGKSKRIPVSKKKEKVDVTQGKGIELLSHVDLNEDTQFEEVRKKSIRDFHNTHPSGSSESRRNDEYDSNNKQESNGKDSDQKNDSDDDKTQSDNENESNSEHETDGNESGSESDQDENKEDEDDEEEVKDELVKTPSNDSDDEDETKITDKAEGDEDEEMDYTISQLYNDVDIRLNEPVDSDKGFVQEDGTDAAMTNIQQGNENPEILQVIEDAHVTLSIVPQKTKVTVTSSSHSSDLAAKINFPDIPYTYAEIVSPMDVHVHHEVPSQQTPTLLIVPVLVISNSSPVFSTVILQ
ncbi:hypothetical protein Tco_0099404 [Tanacetum coccineum]